MSENRSDADDEDTPRANRISRRDLIRGIAAGSALTLSVVATFEVRSLVASGHPNGAPQALSFASDNTATFTVGESLTFPIRVTGSDGVTVTHSGKLPAGVTFTDINR